MKLPEQENLAALDPDFGEMAQEVGRHAWGIPALTMREKAFVFLAADLCSHAVGFPLRTHVTMARGNGVSVAAHREAVRHLAPYVGYPTAAEALMTLAEIERADPDGESGDEPGPADGGRVDIGERTRADVLRLDPDFAGFFTGQMDARWNRPGMTVRERALCTLATDVCQGTLGESFAAHCALARDHGAGDPQIRAVLLLVAEFGIAKAWRAYEALAREPDSRHGHTP